MRTSPLARALMAVTLCVGVASAQGPVPTGPASGASAAGAAPGPGSRGGGDDPPGWALQSARERQAHRARLREAKTAEECRDIVARHHHQLRERAQSLGRPAPAQPQRDPCVGFPP